MPLKQEVNNVKIEKGDFNEGNSRISFFIFLETRLYECEKKRQNEKQELKLRDHYFSLYLSTTVKSLDPGTEAKARTKRQIPKN